MTRPPFLERFHTKLTILVCILAIPAFVLVLYANVSQRRIQAAAIQDGAKSIAELAASGEEDLLNNGHQLLATLTQLPFLVLTTNRQFSELNFANLLKLSTGYLNFGLIETNGHLFCSGLKINGKIDLQDRAYFQKTLKTGKFAVGEFQVGRITGQPSLNLGYPVKDQHGVVRRILFASLRLSKLSDAIAHVHLPAGADILVLDRNGTVLACGANSKRQVGQRVADAPLVRRILEKKESLFVMPGMDATISLHAVNTISDGQSQSMIICVSIPVSKSMAQADRALFKNCLLMSIVGVVVVIASWLYAQRVVLRPVTSLALAAHSLACGNLSARVGLSSGAAELVGLGMDFDNMAERLQSRQTELLKMNETLKAEIEERQAAERRMAEQSEEKQKLEQQFLRAQRMESLGALAGGIAHDLNNALAPIMMGADVLHEAVNGHQKHREVVELITKSAARCTQMVRQIVNFAKGTTNKKGVVQIADVISEMAKVATDTFPKSILIRTRLTQRLFTVRGDSTELHQVLMNLCVNARDAMPNGGELALSATNSTVTEVQAKRHTGAQPGPHVLVEVSDTGSGMSLETMSRIFEPFFTTKEPDKGTGLGLSTVAQIIAKYRGFAEVQSEVGTGTTFRIFLPANAGAVSQERPEPAAELHTGKGQMILVVDDEQFLVELARTTLESYGYRVLTALNGLEALEMFKSRKSEIDLIITDADMPILDGVRTIELIQEIRPDISIIIASGTQRDVELLTGIDTSRISTLTKPYRVEKLLETVTHVLASRNGR